MDNVILALPAECWRWYPTYEGIAQVSTRGDVKTVDRWETCNGSKRFRKGRILKPARNKKGYLFVTLCRNGKKRNFLVHRLVAETFIPNPENKPQVSHRDDDKTNNSVENLSWASAKENNNWGTRNKRIGGTMLNGKLSKAVEAIDPETGKVVKEFPSTAEAQRNGFVATCISACCRDKKWFKTHKGYIWRYKE